MERITFMWDSEQAKSVHKHWRHMGGGGCGGRDPLNFNLGNEWRSVVSPTLLPSRFICSGVGGGTPRSHWLGDWMGSRNGPNVLEMKHITCRYRDLNKNSSVCFLLLKTQLLVHTKHVRCIHMAFPPTSFSSRPPLSGSVFPKLHT
jgi:hypothetical protein